LGRPPPLLPSNDAPNQQKVPTARGTLLNEFKRRYEVLDLQASRRFRVLALCDTATCWLFERYSSDRLTRSSRRITDSFERFMIAQFGFWSLLNQQAGGCGPSCISSTRDTAMLSTIDTTVMRTLAQSVSQNMDLQVKLRLSAITETIYDAIRKRFPMDETTQENIQYIGSHHVKQAVCETLHGYCIAAVIGEAVTEQSIREDTGVCDGSSATRDLIIGYLQECLACTRNCDSSSAPATLDTPFGYSVPRYRYTPHLPYSVHTPLITVILFTSTEF
jgi:hypothetical protein